MNDTIFPQWKPRWQTVRKINSDDLSVRYKTLRTSASNFISRKDVRQYIKAKYHNKCCLCGCEDDLQIDHVVSVLRFAQEKLPYRDLNKEENLILLCRSCNAAKKP